MGRPSKRDERREAILGAFRRVLAEHGFAGATVAVVAAEAEVAPGLLHHHFDNKAEMLAALFRREVQRFRERVQSSEDGADPLTVYVDAALKLDGRADRVGAKCWVSLFAEALRDPSLFRQMRRFVDGEVGTIHDIGRGRLAEDDAMAVLAFILGALVLGAFAPKRTSGFAAPAARRLIAALARG